MDTGERLAAYLSGDLDTDERTAVEAELAGDPALRGHLERIRRSDAALADLPEVDLPEGFSARLRERVAPEVDAVVGDQLAARRARRGTPSWLPALGAAAALAVVVAGGVTLAGGMGGDSAMDTAEEAGPRTTAGDGGGDAAATMMQDAETDAATEVSGPVVTDRGRSLGPSDLQQLATDPDVLAALESGAVQEDPTLAADLYLDALGGARTETEAEGADDAAGADETPQQEDADLESAPSATGRTSVAELLRREGVSDADLDDVARCLSVLSEGAAAPVVPLYVELATDEDGNEVIVYVALAQDADDEYRRVEVWMVSRDDCEPRQFVQSDT